MKITIETLNHGWNIKIGNQYTDLISVDEAIAVITTLLVENSDKRCLKWLKTKKEHNTKISNANKLLEVEFKKESTDENQINHILNNLSDYSNLFKVVYIPIDSLFSIEELIEGAKGNNKQLKIFYDKLNENYKNQILTIINIYLNDQSKNSSR